MMTGPNDLKSAIPEIPRTQEQRRVIAELAEVRKDGRSRAVLLHGGGGTGKTSLVRQLPKAYQDTEVRWLEPIDVDDSQHWLLSNLELYVASKLDPGRQYFARYHEFMSALPRQRLAPASRDMVLDHLNRIKAVFTECYEAYISGTGSSVVVTFDTVEAIRGMYLLRTLTRWIKELPGTLFILAGRSLPSADWLGPVKAALEEPSYDRASAAEPSPRMTVTTLSLGEFDVADCRAYLAPISQQAGLTAEETEKLVHLTQGHPLWLAFTVDYLGRIDLPQEMSAPLDEIRRDLPYHGTFTRAGEERAEAFRRHLVAPYRDADFWHEAINRLAVVRESVSEPIWQQLMADRRLPPDVADFSQAWLELGRIPWIRPRANNRYVTLHDAVAEELAQRVISLNDTDKRRRRSLWERAAGIYAKQADELEGRLAARLPDVDRRLRALDEAKPDGTDRAEAAATDSDTANEAELIHEVADLDRRQQELNQLRAAQLFYTLLFDFAAGSQQFVDLMEQARKRHDILFEDLLAFQMQRFLPGGADENTLGDTIGTAIKSFRMWLPRDGRYNYVQVGLEMASYLIDREHLDAALKLLGEIPEPADHRDHYRFRNLQGNACLRTPGRVREAGDCFKQALADADLLPEPDRHRRRADAHKELGYYYRNIGLWENADEAYEMARDAILQTLSPGSPDSDPDRAERASIYSNWAYLKGIGGWYDLGINLVDSAITIRSRLGRRHEHAISCGVKGEVYRYQRQFKAAWAAYSEAEQLFGEASASWLGVIYQEQAICLFQSIQAGVHLLDPPTDPAKEAEMLILKALALCRVFNTRAYPSALNRAGRIFGATDPDRGLRYLLLAADKAQELSDGWFLLASLTEYAELCYRASAEKKDPRYLELIPPVTERWLSPEIAELQFPELRGRWQILQGHLAIEKAIAGDEAMLDTALNNYRNGFPLITHGWVGSYGTSAIPAEFKKFSKFVWRLRPEVRVHWREELYQSWSVRPESATQLLALLEELY
jgi:AAA ATPase domain